MEDQCVNIITSFFRSKSEIENFNKNIKNMDNYEYKHIIDRVNKLNLSSASLSKCVNDSTKKIDFVSELSNIPSNR